MFTILMNDNKLIISSTQPVSQVSGEWLEILS